MDSFEYLSTVERWSDIILKSYGPIQRLLDADRRDSPEMDSITLSRPAIMQLETSLDGQFI